MAESRASVQRKESCSARTARPPGLAKAGKRPVSAPQKETPMMDIFAKEQEYKRMNAELEARTAEIVRQAEEVMRGQNKVLTKPLPSHLDVELEGDYEDSRNAQSVTVSEGGKRSAKKDSSKNTLPSRQQSRNGIKPQKKKAGGTVAEDVAIVEADFSLEKTISDIEARLDDGVSPELRDDVMPSAGDRMGSEAQIRFLKAKLRVMQEELDRLSHECNKKDNESSSFSNKLKDAEEDRSRLQRTTNIQQSQIEKHRAVVEEANRRCDGLQHQVTALQKEIEELKRAQKQAAINHSATEVRLNRALEEAEKYKTQLNKIKQNNKESASQEHQKIEILQAENKKLEKQKAELIAGFNKQLKLIDILKRQKMHFEAAKMLSFTEEEFVKALDWGKF
ncbi:testis-expressed protein 9 [Denticeps clupeoides]|uniref:Testis expressed 9 n=1 Tax=Denticeps clupeoides TaxID=299321 RepID=A0AAY4B7Z0_9TELE|nr:testis-expressed protein 9 [Denticeps clupeoides]